MKNLIIIIYLFSIISAYLLTGIVVVQAVFTDNINDHLIIASLISWVAVLIFTALQSFIKK